MAAFWSDDPIIEGPELSHECPAESTDCVICGALGTFDEERQEAICAKCKDQARRELDAQYARLMDYHVEQSREVFETAPEDSIRMYWLNRSEYGR